MQQAAIQSGASINLPSNKYTAEELVTADFQDQPAQQVFIELAKRIGLVPEYENQIITFVERDDAQRDFILLRTGYAEPEAAQKSMQSMLGDKAVVELLDDRMVVTGDRRALDQAQKYGKHFYQGADGWLLEVRVVSVTDTMRRELGLDWSIETNLGLNTTGSGVLSNADLIVSVLGKATETGTDAKLLETATLYVLEGSESSITRGQKIPIPKFQTSPEGTTTTAGFDFIEAGFKLEAAARRVPSGVHLALRPSISSVAGFVEQAPITQESTVEVELVVDTGDWIVISGLESMGDTHEQSKLPGLPAPIFGTTTKKQDESSLLVLVQAKRVFTAMQKPNNN